MLMNETLVSQLRFTANRLLQVSRLKAVLCLHILALTLHITRDRVQNMFPCTSALRAKRTGYFLWTSCLDSALSCHLLECDLELELGAAVITAHAAFTHQTVLPIHSAGGRKRASIMLQSSRRSVMEMRTLFPAWKAPGFSFCAIQLLLMRVKRVSCTKPLSTLCWVHPCCFSLGLFTAMQIRKESNLNGCRDCLGLDRGPSCEVFHAVRVLFGYLWSTNASWIKKSKHFLVNCKLLEAILRLLVFKHLGEWKNMCSLWTLERRADDKTTLT